jgi:carbon monoxide dehydrogenase subunit G
VEIDYEATRWVAAPRHACWDLLTDPWRAHEWLTLVSSATAEGEPGVGRVIHARGGMLGISTTTEQVVHLWQPQERYGWRGDDPFPLSVEVTLREAAADTEFVVRATASPGGFFPVGKSVLKRALRTQFNRSADRFQRLVESGA